MSRGILHVAATFTVHTPDLDDDRGDIETAIQAKLKELDAQAVHLTITEQVQTGESA